MELFHDQGPDMDRYTCMIKLYGNLPETFPYVIQKATTAPIAILAALIETLISVEIDYLS